MKNLAKTFAIAVLSALSFISNATNNGSVAPTKSKTFEIGMYQSVNTMKMNIMIEKSTDKNLKITLRNEIGEIICDERVNKNAKMYHLKYDMSELADGKYTFEFTTGDEKIVKEVNLVTTKPAIIDRQIAVQ